MGIGSLRRYHRPRAADEVQVEPGPTPTEGEAAKAAEANAGKLGEVQAEQRELAAQAETPPEGDAIHDVIEGVDVEAGAVAATHEDAPKRNASKADWSAYVAAQETQPEGWEDMTRDQLATAILGEPQAD